MTDITIKIDSMAEKMLAHLIRVMESEPPRPSDSDPAYLVEEITMNHYQWCRQRDAIRLLLGIQLINLTLEQYPMEGIT